MNRPPLTLLAMLTVLSCAGQTDNVTEKPVPELKASVLSTCPILTVRLVPSEPGDAGGSPAFQVPVNPVTRQFTLSLPRGAYHVSTFPACKGSRVVPQIGLTGYSFTPASDEKSELSPGSTEYVKWGGGLNLGVFHANFEGGTQLQTTKTFGMTSMPISNFDSFGRSFHDNQQAGGALLDSRLLWLEDEKPEARSER
jgi:hypothetical protein